jgi:hypothetical protein
MNRISAISALLARIGRSARVGFVGWLAVCAACVAGTPEATPDDRALDQVHARTEAPAARPAVGGSPLAGLETSAEVFRGVVDEVLPAGGYTYLRVRTDAGDRWVATMGSGVELGRGVEIKAMGTRRDFHSRRLDRRFDTLAFGIVRDR